MAIWPLERISALPLDTRDANFTFVKSYDDTRRAVLKLMRRGTMTLPEVAQCAGVSRQLIRHWCKVAKIVIGQAREVRNAREWRKAFNEPK